MVLYFVIRIFAAKFRAKRRYIYICFLIMLHYLGTRDKILMEEDLSFMDDHIRKKIG